MNKKAISNRGELSTSQLEAIKMLVSGCTAKYTALVLKLDYGDVRRWMNKDSLFQSELAAQVKKRRTQPSELAKSSQEMRLRDEQSRRGDFEGEKPPRELASN